MKAIQIKYEIQPENIYWLSKEHAVILTDKEENVDKIFDYLVSVDDYFKPYKNLIKDSDFVFQSKQDLIDLTSYSGRTDLDVKQFYQWCVENNINSFVYCVRKRETTSWEDDF